MGVKFSQLPDATEIASNDMIAMLDVSGNILTKTPVSHASTATVFGSGNTTEYGHVKLSDTYDSVVGTAADGIGASQGALNTVHNEAVALGTTAAPGRLQPDGTSIVVNAQGRISSPGGALYFADYDQTPATRAHVVGDLVYVNSHFYRVTQDIAAGVPIVSGTNVEPANLGVNSQVYVSHLNAIFIADANNSGVKYGTTEAAESQFNHYYDLCNRTTTIQEVNGNTQITEVNSSDDVTSVTTIVATSATVTTITTVVTPTVGSYYYTKTTVITSNQDGSTSIVDSYVQNDKE